MYVIDEFNTITGYHRIHHDRPGEILWFETEAHARQHIKWLLSLKYNGGADSITILSVYKLEASPI